MSETKYTLITEKLEQAISKGTYRHRLPSVPELARQFNVAPKTMMKSLRPLGKRGIIKPHPRGTLIMHDHQQRIKTGKIGIFCNVKKNFQKSDPLLNNLNRMITDDGMTPVFLSDPEKLLAKEMNFWDRQDIDGYIFVYSTFNPEYIPVLKEKKIPFLVSSRFFANHDINMFCWNRQYAFDKILNKLINDGARRIQFFIQLQNKKAESSCRMIIEDFVKAKKSLEIFPDDTPNFIPRNRRDIQEFVDFLFSLDQFPDAIVCWGSNHQLVRILRQHGKETGRDYAIAMRSPESDFFRPEQWQETYFYRYAKNLWRRFKHILNDPSIPPRLETVTYPFKIIYYIPRKGKTI